MPCVNCNKFSPKDLALFIESMEQIIRVERLKMLRQNSIRAKYLADTLRYLSQQYPVCVSSTLSSTDTPEDESLMESFEEKHFVCMTTDLMENYHSAFECDDPIDNNNQPIEHVISTKKEKCDNDCNGLKPNKFDIFNNDQYQGIGNSKRKAKFSLISFIRKKLRKYFGKKTSLKSNSWMKLILG